MDPKRSNAINIGMTKLPPPRTIKAAIMKMDSTIINREGIEVRSINVLINSNYFKLFAKALFHEFYLYCFYILILETFKYAANGRGKSKDY